jgi:hypothetical protein
VFVSTVVARFLAINVVHVVLQILRESRFRVLSLSNKPTVGNIFKSCG